MPIADLSQVTVALRQLLELNLPLIEPALAGGLVVSTSPPEQVQGGQNVLSLYCYHLTSDAGNRFRPRQPTQVRAVETSPLALVLNYILTAHTVTGASEFNALGEQRLLGHAMKTLHDFPVLDDTTMVANAPVLPDEIRGRGNRFEITMMQLSPADALNFWANEDDTTVKPSGYYEVRAVELEPEPPTRSSGIVLTVGNYVVPFGQPGLSTSESDVAFSPPDAPQQTLTSRPARVGPVNPGAPPQTNLLRLVGSNLAEGTLRLRHPLWMQQFPGIGAVAVDTGANGPLGWVVSAGETHVEVTLGDQIAFDAPDGVAQVLDLYPGIYQAAWEVARRVGEDVLTERSNAVPFAIYPFISSLSRAPSGQVTLDLAGTWRLTRGRPLPVDPVAEPELDILFGVGGQTYRFDGIGTSPAAGGFMIQDHAIIYQPDPAQDTSGAHAIRLEVDGVPAQPFWVIVP